MTIMFTIEIALRKDIYQAIRFIYNQCQFIWNVLSNVVSINIMILLFFSLLAWLLKSTKKMYVQKEIQLSRNIKFKISKQCCVIWEHNIYMLETVNMFVFQVVKYLLIMLTVFAILFKGNQVENLLTSNYIIK